MTGFKDFFSKVFGTQSTPVKTTQAWMEKRSNPRVTVSPVENLEVHLLEPGEGDVGVTLVASVTNVSLRGLGLKLRSAGEKAKIQLGQNLVAAIEIERFSVPLTVEVVRFLGEDGMGVRFKPPFPKELVQLEKFLEPRILGPTLREIKTEALQQGEEKVLRWFQGENDTHLFSWAGKFDGAILQQQLIFLERVIEWGRAVPLRTGRVQIAEDATLGGHYGWVRSELLDFDNEPDRILLKQVMSLLENTRISGEIKEAFLRKIKEFIGH